jgi:hypothetical protein
MQEDVRDFLKTLWVPQVPQQKEYSAPRIALYRAVPDTVTGLEKKPPQRESASKRQQVSPTATIRFVRMVKKLKYAMTAPRNVIAFARDVAMVNGNCSSRANHATHAMTDMKMRIGVPSDHSASFSRHNDSLNNVR